MAGAKGAAMIASATYTAIASESGHWYRRDGSPCYEIAKADGEFRPTTLRDARKLDLVPSVTTIIRQISKPGLDKWKLTQLLEASLTLPRLPDEPVDAYALRVIKDSQAQSIKARDAGTLIHGAIERSMSGPYIPTNWETRDCVTAAQSALKEFGMSGPYTPEKSFASTLGYGGKIDCIGDGFIVDFKTKSNWTDEQVRKGLAYDEHGMQLTAYMNGLGRKNQRLANIFISTDSPGKYHVHEWPQETHDRLWRMFESALRYWQYANQHLVQS